MLLASNGRAKCFSFLYSPGATNAQNWYSTTGMAINNATKNVSLNGVNNGEATSVAIIWLPGRKSRRGADTSEKIRAENGSRPMKTTTTAAAVLSSRPRSSTRCDSNVPSAR